MRAALVLVVCGGMACGWTACGSNVICADGTEAPAMADCHPSAPAQGPATQNGRWRGVMTYALSDVGTVSEPGVLEMAIGNTTIGIGGLCKAGPELVGERDYPSMYWEGTHSCRPAAIGQCEQAVITLTKVIISMRDTGALNVSATAAYSGCGIERSMTVLFDATERIDG